MFTNFQAPLHGVMMYQMGYKQPITCKQKKLNVLLTSPELTIQLTSVITLKFTLTQAFTSLLALYSNRAS